MKQLKITISRTGDVRIEAKGYQGTGCLDATAALEAALGGEVSDRQHKPEFYVAEGAPAWAGEKG